MKKYAVYKRPTGYIYNEYIDNLQALAGTVFEKIIPEESLPVVLDGNGGYYKFSTDDYGFEEIIQSDNDPPLPLEKLYFKNMSDFKLGWISPEGDTYSCDFTGHTKAAEIIAKRFYGAARYPETSIGRRGWIKVIDSWDGTERKHGQFVYSFTGKITADQADRLFDIGLYNNPEVKKLIEDSDL